RLCEMGVWDDFVFPSIDWTAKGARIQEIISDMNLRPVNVLFLDDNTHNLEEAAFAVSGLQTALPDQLPALLNTTAFQGKDDSEHSRLKQYRVLETKAAAKAKSASNEEFLYQSDIRVEMNETSPLPLERIYEMIHRNNQLNYTKNRISQDEVNALFTDPSVRSGVVYVRDRYGDHGITGCYAVRDNQAVQFVFSCRVLGMGVEQYVYAALGFPKIDVAGTVAVELDRTTIPGYINQKNPPPPPAGIFWQSGSCGGWLQYAPPDCLWLVSVAPGVGLPGTETKKRKVRGNKPRNICFIQSWCAVPGTAGGSGCMARTGNSAGWKQYV
ncbi:MAG: hypothetical protein IJT94_15285, partial [Oscillibacter sp.]|nr:hypothetical protein [Oscillibacter sp.]